jgi:DNA-binding GntR family transcriptional regulator
MYTSRGTPELGTAQRQAYEFLRGHILSGRYPGGTRLNPAQITQALGVSRTPVREAIRQLDAEGFVTIRPHRGAVVTSFTAEDVLELFEMRAVLEGLQARLAVSLLGEEDLEDLERLKARMDRVREDPKLWTERHHAFHEYLGRRSNRPRLSAQINHLRAAIQPYLLLYFSVYGLVEMPGFEHQTIIDAVNSSDGARAEEAMRDHVMSAATGVVEFLKSSGPRMDIPRRSRRAT